ncbi:MAG: type II toxin-antitoxin system HicB family antitoxin [bacterium]
MERQKFIYYKEDEMYVGYLEEFPDYMTQGETLEELKLNLIDIYKEVTNGHISNVHHLAELEIA